MYTNDTGITKRLSAANTDIAQILKGLRLSNPKNVRLSYLNLKTIRDKLENLEDVNVLAVAETKTDSTFPSAQFFLDGYLSLYRLDISRDSDGLLVYVKQQNHLVTFPYLSSNSDYKRYLLSSI